MWERFLSLQEVTRELIWGVKERVGSSISPRHPACAAADIVKLLSGIDTY